MADIETIPSLPTLPLTHIAAVYYRAGAWRVVAVFPRKTEGLRELCRGCQVMFVPATVRAGDDVMADPGTTTYADPEWAERWVASDK